jgi:hypothetical protein
VLNQISYAVKVGSRSRTGRRLLLGLLAIAAFAFISPLANAGSRSGLVLVSVQVVESCRIETKTAQDSTALDLKMRCSSTAHPSLGLLGSSQALAPVGTVTLPHSQIASTENGKTLNIEF